MNPSLGLRAQSSVPSQFVGSQFGGVAHDLDRSTLIPISTGCSHLVETEQNLIRMTKDTPYKCEVSATCASAVCSCECDILSPSCQCDIPCLHKEHRVVIEVISRPSGTEEGCESTH